MKAKKKKKKLYTILIKVKKLLPNINDPKQQV
jgi:hypothetical protein